MTIDLQPGIIYGPVSSRRFGRSLGINPLPTQFKLCNFECVYCQYGEAHPKGQSVQFPSLQAIEKETRLSLERLAVERSPIDSITIAGNGEPTLYPRFGELVDLLLSLRDRYLPKTKVGILSNATTCHRAEIRSALEKLDGRFMKLDAGDAGFSRVNHPSAGLSREEVVGHLSSMKDIVIQSMFVTGSVDNTGENDLQAWIGDIGRIRPLSVQIYTIDRPPSDPAIQAVPQEALLGIADRLRRACQVNAEVY